MTGATQEAFKDNIAFSIKISQLVDEIAAASKEQSEGIQNIHQAITEIDKVTQISAVHADQSSGASEKMNRQVENLKEHVSSIASIVEMHV